MAEKETMFRVVLREDGWALVLRMSPLEDTEVTVKDKMTKEGAQHLLDMFSLAFDNWYGDESHEFDY